MSEVDKIFGAFDRISELAQRRDEVARLKQSCVKRCGWCDDWMKSSKCPREKNVGGMSRGPSMNDSPCSQFVAKPGYADAVKRYEDALAAPL